MTSLPHPPPFSLRPLSLLKILHPPIQNLSSQQSLLATFVPKETQDFTVTFQVLSDFSTTGGLERIDVQSISSKQFSEFLDGPSTLLFTPALIVLSNTTKDIHLLIRRTSTPHPGPSFIGCLPGTTLDWSLPTIQHIQQLACIAAQKIPEATWEISFPLSAHQRLAFSVLPQAGIKAITRLLSTVKAKARVHLLVQHRAAAVIFQSLLHPPHPPYILAAVALECDSTLIPPNHI